MTQFYGSTMPQKATLKSASCLVSKLCLGTAFLFLTSSTVAQARINHPVTLSQSPVPQLHLLAHELPDNLDHELPDHFECPEGTTFNTVDSTDNKLVCEIDRENPPLPEQDNVYVIPKDPSSNYGRIHVDELDRLINPDYPDWYRQNDGSNMASDESHHYYYRLLGPDLEGQFQTENIGCTSYHLRGRKMYFSHNHPYRQFYYVISGEAEWYIMDPRRSVLVPIDDGDDDDDNSIEAGSLIVLSPYVPHGMRNTSANELHAFLCSWQEPGDPENSMGNAGLPTDPCRVERRLTARPYHVEPVCRLFHSND
ncbi:MAG: cupin domain-containing protein [Spirulina sp. SIO3F2]|nr:cupin domain-containing protein [Spirulina sp. SIO3F2]